MRYIPPELRRAGTPQMSGSDPFMLPKPQTPSPGPSPAAMQAEMHNTTPPTANLSMMLSARRKKNKKLAQPAMGY